MVAITVQPSARQPSARPTGVRLAMPHRRTSEPGASARAVTAVLAAVAALLAVGFLTLSQPLDTAGIAAEPAVDGVHVVAEGETMWSIARDVAPAGEAAAYVERLVAANGGASVVVGQHVRLPRS